MQSPARWLVFVAVVATTTRDQGFAQTMKLISGDKQQVCASGARHSRRQGQVRPLGGSGDRCFPGNRSPEYR